MLFPQVLKHFLNLNLMNVSKDIPGILHMDNHHSHTTLEVIDMARENDLIILFRKLFHSEQVSSSQSPENIPEVAIDSAYSGVDDTSF
ncbi:hypothetical protein PoB_006747800 [Plakobranchus ocellatus]|uniref:DDE-1 domain-containing protein n=1 Tax=Plakobranchus ocellatus TaxID=259542 RepID=A0AAV4DA93_9GAST|nr:hypothetical protein PoB_006747800 [Plakobranchus ocellatus]